MKHGVTQEEINYWVEHYSLMKDRECYRRYEEVNESQTAETLTKAYLRASQTDNILEEDLSQEDDFNQQNEYLDRF